VAADPSQGSLDHPSFWQDDEAPGDIGSLDDLDLPCAGSRGCCANARSLIAAIGVDALDEGELSSRSFVEHQRRTIAVLDIGGMNDDIQQEAERVDEDVALAARDLLASIEALWIEAFAPFWAALALWLSMMATLGLASRPSRSRDWTYNAWWMRSSVPSQSHSMK